MICYAIKRESDCKYLRIISHRAIPYTEDIFVKELAWATFGYKEDMPMLKEKVDMLGGIDEYKIVKVRINEIKETSNEYKTKKKID